jgi:putative ABC transport system permease protein
MKSAWSRRLTLSIVLFSIVLSTFVLLAVERVRADARVSFMKSISGVDLIVGARTSPIQLMLYSVFHSGAASNNMSMDSFEVLTTHPLVAWVVPVSLGDSHRGFPVLGTTPSYFSHLRYGNQQQLAFSAGLAFAGSVESVFEAVIGAQVAKELGYRLGDRITLSHGMDIFSPEHSDKPFQVMGILAPTGTPTDRSVIVSLEAITAIHLDWSGGAPLSGLRIPAEQVRKFNLRPNDITAVFIGLKSRTDVFKLQRHIHDYRAEPLLAAMPGVALDELWTTISMIENILFIISSLVVVIGLAGLTSTLLAGLNERRRELAILRSVGAGPSDIFFLLVCEGFFVTLLGVLLGYAFLAATIAWLGPSIQSIFGVILLQRFLNNNEWLIVFSVLITSVVTSLVLGWRAWRMSLSDGLTPRF